MEGNNKERELRKKKERQETPRFQSPSYVARNLTEMAEKEKTAEPEPVAAKSSLDGCFFVFFSFQADFFVFFAVSVTNLLHSRQNQDYHHYRSRVSTVLIISGSFLSSFLHFSVSFVIADSIAHAV